MRNIFSSEKACETVCLWEGEAPGSEAWDHQENIVDLPGIGPVIQNVVNPSMTVSLPDPQVANGVAVIVCPGGAFRMLSWDEEGVKTAMRLNKEGFAAFVLKYRLLKTDNIKNMRPPGTLPEIKLSLKYANANPAPENYELNNVISLAISDGQQAIRLVRRNAEKWNIDPAKIGIMGFSAGGGVAVGTALLNDPEGYPDFVATLYGPSMVDVHVPSGAPPLFIAVAANHKPVSLGCVALYSAWNEAGKSAELHVFSQGVGPFGVAAHGLTSDAWISLFLNWIKLINNNRKEL